MPEYALQCESYGVRFTLRAASESLLQQAVQHLPHGTQLQATDHASETEFALESDGAALYRLRLNGTKSQHEELFVALERLGTAMMVHVANCAPDFVFLHAGVVGWHGGAIVLPGPSFAGKTTLVAALVRAGATYYSDEYAVIDEAGRVHPYTRALQMREPGRSAQNAVPVTQLGGHAGVHPIPAAQVVFCEWAAEATWSPQSISGGMAILEMLRHTIPVQRAPARVMATLSAMITGAHVFRTQRREAAEAARELLAFHSGRA